MDKDPNQSWFELIISKGILEYLTIVGFDKGDSGKYVYDKTQDQVQLQSLNIIFAKISFTSFTFTYRTLSINWLPLFNNQISFTFSPISFTFWEITFTFRQISFTLKRMRERIRQWRIKKQAVSYGDGLLIIL